MKDNIVNTFTFTGKIVRIEKLGAGRLVSIEQDVSGYSTTFNLVIPQSAFEGVSTEKIPPLTKGDIILVENAYCYEKEGTRRERIDSILQVKVLFSTQDLLNLGTTEAKELFSK